MAAYRRIFVCILIPTAFKFIHLFIHFSIYGTTTYFVVINDLLERIMSNLMQIILRIWHCLCQILLTRKQKVQFQVQQIQKGNSAQESITLSIEGLKLFVYNLEHSSCYILIKSYSDNIEENLIAIPNLESLMFSPTP